MHTHNLRCELLELSMDLQTNTKKRCVLHLFQKEKEKENVFKLTLEFRIKLNICYLF